MRRKDEREMTIQEAKKVARAALRLKYSILAEREINETLPVIEAAIDEAFASGESFRLNPVDFFELPKGIQH
jgi:hypothetical protein